MCWLSLFLCSHLFCYVHLYMYVFNVEYMCLYHVCVCACDCMCLCLCLYVLSDIYISKCLDSAVVVWVKKIVICLDVDLNCVTIIIIIVLLLVIIFFVNVITITPLCNMYYIAVLSVRLLCACKLFFHPLFNMFFILYWVMLYKINIFVIEEWLVLERMVVL